LEAHRDAVGVLNIAARCGEYAVRPMAWPMNGFKHART